MVFLLGAGPGDPGLITVRALDRLRSCDAVVYDALVNPQLLRDLAAERPEIERHFVGKRGSAEPAASQEEINRLLVRLARAGKRVARLKGGDPFVFGRGGEEAQALAREGIPFEIVPGITAGVAAPAYAGIPVTHRGVSTSVTFVTGHEDPGKSAGDVDWPALARAGGTLVLYMGVGRLATIVRSLLSGGMKANTPAAVVEWGTYPRQRTVTATLGEIVDVATRNGIEAPSIAIVGEVVSLRDAMRWFDTRPLHGRRIIVTRARAQSSDLRAMLETLGADVIEAPALMIERLTTSSLGDALAAIGRFDWIVFTSRNSVEIVWEAVRSRGGDARLFGGIKIAAVGPGTGAALRARGLESDVLPDRFVAEGLVEAFRERPDIAGTRILFPRAAGAREVLPDALRAMGADVDEVEIYRAVPDAEGLRGVAEVLERDEESVVTFTSSSTVRFFVDGIGLERARSVRAASIGPITTGALAAFGIPVAIEAPAATIPALVGAIVAHYAGSTNAGA